ncbi:hypothetical protein [Streptomyces sp. NPDC056983]|uniref:hypothetical protein n=1 Tax=Streptomyces sp. NPDC056983 TaxID=3345987 RepID=UPI003635408C
MSARSLSRCGQEPQAFLPVEFSDAVLGVHHRVQLSRATAVQLPRTLGTGAALAFGGLVFAAGRLAQWRLDQRRYDRWGREWDQVGPRWGRSADGGS